jgi:hypothetical protein
MKLGSAAVAKSVTQKVNKKLTQLKKKVIASERLEHRVV